MRSVILLTILLPVFYSSVCQASGVQVGRTRIIYDAGKKEIALPLTNADSQLPWLIQSWTDTGDEKTRGPFIVTPPLFRLDPQKEQTLRIAWNGTALPENKETLFYMNVRTIPATAKEDEGKNVLRLIYKTRLKLFWRPKQLKGSQAESCEKLAFERQNNALKITNPHGYYTVFDSVRLGATSLGDIDMVAPFSARSFTLPANAAGNKITWRCITDYGNASKPHSTTLKG